MNDLISEEELIDNPTARVPICLVLDCSFSMNGTPIQELNNGVKKFFDAIREDEVARYSAEISVVTFGGSVEKLLDFGAVENQKVPELNASGNTPMGKAVSLTLDLLEDRKKMYKEAGVDYYQPWMVLMSDGRPTDSIEKATKKTSKMVNAKKLTIMPIIIGDELGAEVIEKFSPRRPPLRLKGLKFQEFFEWLSQSVSRVSQSTPGEKIPLDLKGLEGWANL